MWELGHKEGWAPKNLCFQTGELEKTLENPLDSKEVKLDNPKGNQPWIFIVKTDAEAEFPILWTLDAQSWLTATDSHAGKGWGQKKKAATGDDVVGWHHRFNGHELSNLWEIEKDREAWCPWGHKLLDTTEWLNNNTHQWFFKSLAKSWSRKDWMKVPAAKVRSSFPRQNGNLAIV